MLWVSVSLFLKVSVIYFYILEFCSASDIHEANNAIRCTLAQTAPEDCSSLPAVKVPEHVTSMFSESLDSVQEALRTGNLRNMWNSHLSSLPIPLLYLIPRTRLSELSGGQLGSAMQSHRDDSSLAHQISASLRSTEHLLQILNKLKTSTLSPDVQQVFGEKIHFADLTNETFFEALPNQDPVLQEPILAYVRPSVMLNLPSIPFHKLMQRLKKYEMSKVAKKESLYVIASAVVRHQYPADKVDWVVAGLTADDIRNDSLFIEVSKENFKLHLTPLQARAVFERAYDKVTLHKLEYIDSQPLMSQLSPELLQKFSDRDHSYDPALVPSKLTIPTAVQMLEYLMADVLRTGKQPKGESKWEGRIKNLGQWVFALPLSALSEYLAQPMQIANQLTIQSSRLSPMQAYYITSRGTALTIAPSTIEHLSTLLHACPASHLTSKRAGEISSRILEKLVANLPADNLPRTLSLVHKIASSIGQVEILRALTENKDVNKIMSLISPKDLLASADYVLRTIGTSDNFKHVIQQLPQPVLTALLDRQQLQKPEKSGWDWKTLFKPLHVNNLLIGGLTCYHIEALPTMSFVPIIAEYNRVRKNFPKNLQYCSLQKLISHLKLKKTLTQLDEHFGIMSILEPVEIESVGGYVLAELPIEALKQSPYLGQILTTIGKLSNAQLLQATNPTHLQEIAKLATRNKTVDVYVARNLVWHLLDGGELTELRLMLEAGMLDTTICLTQQKRGLLAATLTSKFGEPDTWTASVLVTLQDLLVVFTEEELNRVSRGAWTEAADSLVTHYADDVDWVQPTPFYKVCSKILGTAEEREFRAALGRMMAWRLKAAQWQLNTVHRVSQEVFSKPTLTHHKSVTNLELDQAPNRGASLFNMEEYMKGVSEQSATDETSTSDSTTNESTTEETNESSSTETSSTPQSTTVKQISTNFPTVANTTTTTMMPAKTNATTKSMNTTRTMTTTPNNNTTTKATHPTTPMTTPKIDTATKPNETTSTKTTTVSTTSTQPSTATPTRKQEILPTNKPHSFNAEKDQPNNKNGTVDRIGGGEHNTTSVGQSESNTIPDNKVNTTGLYKDLNNNTQTTTSKVFIVTNNTLTNTNNTENITKETTNKPIIKSETLPINGSTKYPVVVTSTPSISVDEGSQEKNENPTTKPIVPNVKEDKSLYPEVEENETIEDKALNFSVPAVAPVVHPGSRIDGENTIKDDDDDEDYDYEEDEDKGHSMLSGETVPVSVERKRRDVDSTNTLQLTCNALKMAGKLSGLALTEDHINQMTNEELDNCRMELGTMELSQPVLKLIWKNINKKDGIHMFGGLLQAAAVADFWHIEWDVKHPWTLELIDAIIKHVNNSVVLDKVASEIQNANADLTPELLAVLGGVVCSLEEDQLRFLSVAELQPWSKCPPCLPRLAQLAIDKLGDVSSWTPHHVHALHAIVAGLKPEDWKSLVSAPYKPLAGLHPTAISCLNNSYIEMLSQEQLKLIPSQTLFTLSEERLAALNTSQLWSFEHKLLLNEVPPTTRIYVAGIPIPKSEGACYGPTIYFIIAVSLLSVYNLVWF